jgi:hypothetical protein
MERQPLHPNATAPAAKHVTAPPLPAGIDRDCKDGVTGTATDFLHEIL